MWYCVLKPSGKISAPQLITDYPSPGRAARVCQRMVKGPATGTPDPVCGDPVPDRNTTHQDYRSAPMPRNPPTVPLLRMTVYYAPPRYERASERRIREADREGVIPRVPKGVIAQPSAVVRDY